jgi:hypothetical protein
MTMRSPVTNFETVRRGAVLQFYRRRVFLSCSSGCVLCVSRERAASILRLEVYIPFLFIETKKRGKMFLRNV